jgi:hypothetical protein
MASRPGSVRLRTYARSRQHEGLRETAANEAEARQSATQLARTQARTAKRDIDVRAAGKLEAVERDRELAEARVTAREQRATAKAKADVSDAAATKAAARRGRSQAAQLGRAAQAK